MTLTLPRRRLGRTEMMIPVIPFGTQGFGNNFGPVSDEEAIDLVKYSISVGANHFDSARCYGDSQRKLGLAMKEIPRKNVIITARVCCHSAAQWGGYGQGRPDYSRDRVLADVENQLQELNVDYVDGLMIHDPPEIDPTLESDGTLEGLLECKKRGYTRFIGYGMRPHDFHLKAIATGEIDFFLCFNDYNLVRQTIADRVLSVAADADIGVMNGWSILRGMLTGVDLEKVVAETGRWQNDKDLKASTEIWRWCKDEGIDILQLALQFCLREKRIHGNNIGSLNKQQLLANVTAASTPLADGILDQFDHFRQIL